MGKSKSKKRFSNKRAVWWSSIILLILILIFVFRDNDAENKYPDQRAEKTELVRSCTEWKSQYPTIQSLGENGFTLGKGTWVLELTYNEWQKIHTTHHTWFVSEYNGTTKTRTPDKTVTGGPGTVRYKGVHSSLEFKGKGCLLLTTSRTVKETWFNAKPVTD